MKLGANWTGWTSSSLVANLIKFKKIDYCEILLDNFFHFSASDLNSFLGDTPVAFHVMNSRYLESDLICLKSFLQTIVHFKGAMNPIYISDHLAQFTHSGRLLPRVTEIDYDRTYQLCKDRIDLYQEIIGEILLVENFPSQSNQGKGQVQFYRSLMKDCGCGLLFDISNAIVADLNGGDSWTDWSDLFAETKHFHIAGFGTSSLDENLYIDSHDSPLSETSLQSWLLIKEKANISSLTIERDFHLEYESWLGDFNEIRARS
ncbi:MAG: DUF692 family protein [Bdellovibrionales bacterium]|nr:DUF692 family protein [Bdellovibrionales bacterium]